ncbi:unnamed protein product [Penicillium salamii]|uniref:N-acetyltransferase B complex, non-catalytic subunit n=1 Tax=Penicillium salamii TaxID=1612424 RepID=A0A9W4J7K4_9EURO|nr:unnamed protein product [Penicillium salamii]CAG8200135.1 unnamed protein product [Penicillium salamii]CAG8374263.1 unnamed protein product [Penicillium salamii]CAG8401977.1 unnamed protein product [Penicillium salamii]CAG8411691.1 unnamed protein product [Penicillium salamii]
MSSSNDAVFLRRNNQVQDAIDSQNMKQALQLIEKRIKKGENTQFLKASHIHDLQVWKANILFNHTDETHKKRGMGETLQLCKAEPAISDIDSLDILHRTLQKMDDHTELRSTIWEKAAKAKPQDHTLQMRWFTLGFEAADWKTAQKAAMSLQKNFPRERKYYFWAIFLCHIISENPASSEMDRKLFGTLAYRMISKAAADIPADQTQLLSAPRALQTSEELYFLLRVYKVQERWAEALKVLESETTGTESRLANNDRVFLLEKLFFMGSAGVWKDAYAFTKQQLAVPESEAGRQVLKERDDWKTWNLFISVPRNLPEEEELISEVQQHIEKFIAYEPRSRNAHIALLDVVLTGLKHGVRTEEDLILTCRNYFDANKSNLYAFMDLRGVMETRDDSMVDRITDYCMESVEETPDNIIPLINAYKLRYHAQISGNRQSSKSEVESLVQKCIELYNAFTPKTQKTSTDEQGDAASMESRPADDFCLIAAMALVSSSEAGETPKEASQTTLIRAAGLLEQLLIISPHNSGAILILIRIYLLLGAGSIALKLFSRLSVKQMQYESIAHVLYTRFATIHPHQGPPIEDGEYKDFDPQAAFIKALDFYRAADITVGHNLNKALNGGSYVGLEDSIELGNRLRYSQCRKMWALDVRRMQRLTKGEHLSFHEDVAQSTSIVHDNRNFDALPSFERLSQPKFEEHLRLGPLPKAKWLSSARTTDRLFSILASIGHQRPVDLSVELPAIGDLSLSEAETDQTVPEKDAAKAHFELLKVALFMAGSKTHTTAQVENALSQMEDWLKSKRQILALDDIKKSALLDKTTIEFIPGTPAAPTWEYFHAIWTLVETLQATWKVIDLDSRKSIKTAKLPSDSVKRIETLVLEVFELIRSNTRALKQGLTETATLSTLIDLVNRGDPTNEYSKPLQDALERMADDSALEVFCGELRDSWEEALDGVLGARI